MTEETATVGGASLRGVPVDWEALEDAFENNAPEVHSYLHLLTGEVLRIVDGVADPQMHARIAADNTYLRIDPVSSREQYRWMERYIPMVDDPELRAKLAASIDGKGAFRRFKDVLMAYGPERERWFAFRSERLRIFMEAWLNAHSLHAVPRPAYVPELASLPAEPASGAVSPSSSASSDDADSVGPASSEGPREGRRPRSGSDVQRRALAELAEGLGSRDLESVVAFAEFLKAKRATRAFALAAAPDARREGPGVATAAPAHSEYEPTELPHVEPGPVAAAGDGRG